MGNKTGRIAVLGAWLTAGAVCFASAAQAQTITVGNATGAPGGTVAITATLTSGATGVAGTQNDIMFAAPLAVAAKANAHPDCAVNADINKGATSFAFRPNGCTGAACTSIRALVLATDNVDPIPSGSVMYTCNVTIAAGAAGGDQPLPISGVILSDANGNQIPGATGVNGTVTVSGPTGPTLTPTSGAGPTLTPTTPPLACVAPSIEVETVTVAAGTVTTPITATLHAGTIGVAGTQNDIMFAAPIAVAAKANAHPDCTVNADINKGATSFAFRPNGCTGAACTSIRALVLATDNVDPIPDGSVMYTCNVSIQEGVTTGSFPLTISGVILSDPNGNQIPGATGCNGGITIGGATPTPTNTGGPIINTQTPTSTTGASATPTPTSTTKPVTPATNTPTVNATATATRTHVIIPTSVPTAAPFDDDGGCNISTTGSSNAGWLVLIPAIGLLVLRRRSR